MEIKKDTYEKLDTDGKLLVLFDIVSSNNKTIIETCKKVELLEAKSKWSTVVPGITGAVSATAIMLGKIFIWK